MYITGFNKLRMILMINFINARTKYYPSVIQPKLPFPTSKSVIIGISEFSELFIRLLLLLLLLYGNFYL